MLEDNQKEIGEAEKENDHDLVSQILNVRYELKQAETGLANQLGIVVAK